jgi:hypothetical protein
MSSASHVCSGRKFSIYSFWELAGQTLNFLSGPFSAVKDPARLKVFYGGRR